MDCATAIQVFAYIFTIVLLLLPAVPCEEIEFNYDILSKNGPFQWGNKPGWHLCKNGTRQSPINLQENRITVVFNSGIQRNYRPANATLRSTDHDIMVDWTEDAGYISINGTQYPLIQCHWHSPSEHKIDGKRYELELHLVHRRSAEEVAVIGILYDIGNSNKFISTIEDGLKMMADNKINQSQLGIVDPQHISGPGIARNKYFRYNGSLTTPPCNESVTWTVSTELETVTWEQIRWLRKAVDGNERYTNARPVQPLNGRLVQLYKPKYGKGN